MEKYVYYLRVSTNKQGDSGLGLSAQEKTCIDYINSKGGIICGKFVDVASGKDCSRVELWKAIEYCKANSCTLVVAKLDRLSRDAEFVFHVVNTGIDIYFCDLPVVNTMVLGIFASVAQYERELISKRTKDALAANKARGILSGTANSNYRIDEESKKQASRASARTRNRKVVESAEFACFCRILRKVIPILNENSTDEELFFLNWTKYRTSFVLTQYHKAEIKELMQEANRNNNKLFIGIDFTNANFYQYISSRVQATFNSISKYKEYKNL